MSHRAAGVSFIAIAAFLYAARYVAAALYGSGMPGWSGSLFRDLLGYVGNGPTMFAALALLIGIAYLVRAEFEKPLKRTAEQIRDNWQAGPHDQSRHSDAP